MAIDQVSAPRSGRNTASPRLEVETFNVTSVEIGSKTELVDGRLTINVEEMKSKLLGSDLFEDIEIEIVRPGDNTRLIHVIDVVEPRTRVSDPDTDFPGLLSVATGVGSGITNRLSGVAVVTVGDAVPGEPTYWREAVIDMAGEVAALCPFSSLINVVVTFQPRLSRFPDSSLGDNVLEGSKLAVAYNREMRLAGLRAAVYLASAAAAQEPDSVATYELSATDPNLPGVVFLFQMQAPYVYGEMPSLDGPGHLPTVIHPNEILDGALVNSFTVIACMRECTFDLQNHPVVDELYRRHGSDLRLKGVVLYSAGDSVNTKQRMSTYAANVASLLGAEGAVLNYLGGGHAMVDFMLVCQKLEQRGVKTVLVSPEMAVNPEDSGFVHFVREADAIVSTGNYEQLIELPEVDRVIGGTNLFGSDAAASAAQRIPLRLILGSTNQFGSTTLRGRQL